MPFTSTPNRLRNVEELLLDSDTPLRKRLVDAGHIFSTLTRHDSEWPAELKRGADRIHMHLVVRGSIARSVQAMAEEGVEEVARELLRFARSAAQLLRDPGCRD